MGANNTKEVDIPNVKAAIAACDEEISRIATVAPEPLKPPKCPVCQDPMRDSILLCQRGHSVCGACVDRLPWRRQARDAAATVSCPVCRQPMTAARNWDLEHLVARANVDGLFNSGEKDQGRAEATVQWTLTLGHLRTMFHSSPTFYVRDLPWSISVEYVLGFENIYIYLMCINKEPMCSCEASKWPFRAEGEVRVLPYAAGVEAFRTEFNEKCYSCCTITESGPLLAPQAGYVHNNKLTIEVCLKIRPLSECSVPHKKIPNKQSMCF